MFSPQGASPFRRMKSRTGRLTKRQKTKVDELVRFRALVLGNL